MSKLNIALFAGACALVGGLVSRALVDDPTPAVKTEVVKEYVFAPASERSADTAMAVATPFGRSVSALPPASAARPSSLGRTLLETRDVRAFVVEALQRPESGGGFYAVLALAQCSGMDDPAAVVQRVVAEETTITAERMNRISAVVERCSHFSVGEIESMRAEALRLGLEGRDPLMSLQLQLHKTRVGTPERDRVLDEMFKGNAAQASQNFVPLRLLQGAMSSDANGKLVYRFNGQSYTSTEDQQALDAAARMSTCGDDYCALDGEMILFCKGPGGICYASRDEYLQAQVFKGDRQLFDRAARFSREIRDAMARGDRSVFQ